MRFFVTATAIVIALARTGSAYEAVEVENGGGVSGVVTLKGDAPAPERQEIDKDVTVCGHHVEDRSVLVDEDGGLANAAVYLADIESGRPSTARKPAGWTTATAVSNRTSRLCRSGRRS